MGIENRYKSIVEEVASVCLAAGRNPDDVQIIAVSKTVGPCAVAQAIAGGALNFGENRPEGLIQKSTAYPQANWHFIGNIQSRRIADIVSSSSLIHSLYEQRHALKIDAAAASIGKIQEVLLEINISGEESKSGLSPADAQAFLDTCLGLSHIRVRGLMTMAPQGDAAVAQATFEGLATLKGSLQSTLSADKAAQFDGLSMGMSEDWRAAVGAGATMVRIGRAIFSDGL